MSSKNVQKKINALGSVVGRDYTQQNILVIEKDLSKASDSIRDGNLSSDDKDKDKDNTILIRKLKKGEFNSVSIDFAITQKLSAMKIVIRLFSTEEGKKIYQDINENLLSLINIKYISQMDEGAIVKTSLPEMTAEFSAIAEKYKDLVKIDEAFVLGLLYINTSECAFKWRIEASDAN